MAVKAETMTAREKWKTLSCSPATLRALRKVWFPDGKRESLTAEETEQLQALFAQHPFGQSNFNTWLKETLRQIQANAAMEELAA